MPLDKAGKFHMNPMDIKDEPADKPQGKAPKGDKPADEVKISISKKPEGGYKSTMDTGDELGADEMEHGSLAEAHAAHAKALEEKFGESAVEKAEEEVAPGIHKAVEQKLEGGKGILEGMKR